MANSKLSSTLSSGMNLFQLLSLSFSLWMKYGDTFKNFLNAIDEIKDLENGQLFNQIAAIFEKYGFPIGELVAGITGGVGDTTNIKTIQALLNESGLIVGTISVSGYLDEATRIATKQFQVAMGFVGEDIDGVPGEQTIKALITKVGK